MQERGVEVDPSTIMRWVHRYAPELEKRVPWYQGYRSTSWRVEETYVKVGGKWKYLFRAVDKQGRLIGFMLSDRRNSSAAQCFLGKALKSCGTGRRRRSQRTSSGPIPKLSADYNGKASCQDRQDIAPCKYLNNIIKADHGALKRVIKPTRGFQTMRTAAATRASR